ncbi:MAG TPA: Ran-binding zinc finger domain-containing protein [Actinomycetota bacterium]|nr:Ran-binding zinc finger domain-containing protein [Actinomycetota bacterium]
MWECPACQTENPIEAPACRVCGTPFARLLEEERRGPALEPGRAVSRSLLFPGLGHAAAGRGAEGLARAVVFGYTLAIVVTVLVMRSGEGFGPFLPLVLISAAAGIALYALSAVDAGRLARGEQQVLSSRALLYGAVGLMLVTIVILVIVGTRVGGRT